MTIVTTFDSLALIKQFEGLRLQRYQDSVGVWTIGYGTTESALGHPVPETCTVEQADAWLLQYVQLNIDPAIDRLGVPLNPYQRAALRSILYNCGPGILDGKLGDDLRARDYWQAGQDFLLYVYAGGQILQGLVNRRAAEQRVFRTRWVDPDPHHYLRFDTTIRDLGAGRHGSERAIVEELDRERQHALRFPGRLGRLRTDCRVLAARLDGLLEADPEPAKFDRGWRREQLRERADNQRIV